jgi:hypothetical protein
VGARRAGFVRVGFRRADATSSSSSGSQTGSSSTADWGQYPAAVRVYAIDYDGGSDDDSNPGYVDATGVTDTLITIAMQAAGIAPLKTWEEFLTRLPGNGAGRAVIVAIKNRAAGATYKKQDGTTTQDLTLRGYPGYVQIRILGTSDFSNSATDKIKSGAITSDAGPNGDGSWTVSGAGTTLSCTITGTLPADPTALGRRMRFDAATTTSALRNKGVTIQNNTATGITFANAAAAAPQNGDTFFIEKPGVVFGAWTIDVQSPIVIRGLASASGSSGVVVQCGTRDLAVDGFHPTVSVSFCSTEGTVGTFIMGSFYVWCRSTLASIDPSGASENTGGGWRSGGTFNVEYVTRAIIDTSGAVTNNQSFWVEIPYGAVGQGCYFVGGATPILSLDTCGAGSVAGAKSGNDWGTFSGAFHFGTGQLTASFSPTRIDGRLRLQGSPIAVDGVAITQAGAGSDSAALSLRMEGGEVRIMAVTGSTGNTAYGIGLTRCRNTRVVIQGTTTLTGTSGDIIDNLQDDSQSVALSYTGLSTTNVVDDAGNDICKATIPKYIAGPALALQNKDGTALALGEIVRISAAAQCVRAQADTSAHAAGPLYVALAATANNVFGLFVPMTSPQKWVLFDAATPTIAALSYISPGTAGAATVTVPAPSGTNQKRRVGHVVANSGSLGLVTGSPELLQVTSDGVAP